MTVSDADQKRVTDLLLRDVVATIGAGHELEVEALAACMRGLEPDPTRYAERVVGEFQQQIHDEFIDTAWPRCPRHPNHPMWFHEGAWHADGRPIAPLGDLGSVVRDRR